MRYARLNTSVLYSVRAAENLVADASVPVTAPLVASLVNAAPFTVSELAVTIVNVALLATLLISLAAGAEADHVRRVDSEYPSEPDVISPAVAGYDAAVRPATGV